MTKPAKVTDGVWLRPCVGCGFIMRQTTETLPYRDVNTNWTLECPACKRRLCITCFPVGAETCALPDCAQLAYLHQMNPNVLHFTEEQRAE